MPLKDANKFFIRTRTAAMGVRGTDFQTIYNPDNKMTSLLTYRGEVAMARVDEKTNDMLEEAPTREIERNDITKEVEIKQIPGKKMDEVSELNKLLKSNTTVLVPPGQNSFSSEALKKASLPVKISPVQLEVLYKNTDFNEKAAANVNLHGEADKIIITSLKTGAQKAPIEGVFNEKTGDFAPKAGGFIDLKTGLYVAPGADAVLDKERGVFVSKKSGDFDTDTGQYVAPKGLILDAKKGFILESEADKKPELLALREDLNKNIAKDIVVFNPDEPVVALNINEKFIRDHVSLSLWNINQNIKLNQNRDGNPFLEIDSKRSARFGFEWAMSSNNRFSPVVNFDYGVVNFDDTGVAQTSKKTIALAFGPQFALSRNVNLFAKIGIFQEHFIDQTSTGFSYALQKITLTRFSLGANSEFWKGKKWSLDGTAAGLFTFRKKLNNVIVHNGTGFILEALPKYELKDHQWLGLGFRIEKQLQRIDGSASLVQNKEERSSNGVLLKYISEF
jgi:hypothetical protein